MWKFFAAKSDRLDRIVHGYRAPGSEWLSANSRDWLIEHGFVRVDEKRLVKSGIKVREGASIEVHFPGALQLPLRLATPQSAPTVFSSRDYGVFFKEPGIPTIPLRPWEEDSFVHRVVNSLKDKISPETFFFLSAPPSLEGGVLQRLDFFTSGLVCVAFTREAKALFRQLFSEKRFSKTYWCLLELSAAYSQRSDSFSIFFEHREAGKERMRSSVVGAPTAVSLELQVKILKRKDQWALAEVQTESGARHVVRSGLSAIGAPLWNDEVYGQKSDLPGHFQLHARTLQLLAPEKIPDFPAPLIAPPPDSFLESQCLLGLGSAE